MPFTTEYANSINLLNVVRDVASENLVPGSVWRPLVIQTPMPQGTQTVELKKDGSLGRLVLPENTQYTYGAYSEYAETSVILNPIKSVVISRTTDEAERFSLQSPASKIGREQGKALMLGMEEDIATLAAGFTSSVVTATPLTQLDVMTAALNIQISTNGHAVQDGNVVVVLHPHQAYQAGIVDPLSTGAALAVYGNSNSSQTNLLENLNASRPSSGFVTSLGSTAIYATNVIDDDGTSFFGLAFDRSRALVGMWDDAVRPRNQQEIEFFRDRIGNSHYSDFEILWDEAGCRIESPVL